MTKIFNLTLMIFLIVMVVFACNTQVSQIGQPENIGINDNTKEVNEANEGQIISGNDIDSIVEGEDSQIIEDEEIIDDTISEEIKEDQADSSEEEKMIALYQKHNVNEMGQIMVIMYHNLAEEEGLYATTPEIFKEDLIRLHTSGYRLVTMSDVVNNTIDIPIGMTPVVVTFDDGDKSNFYYDETGEIAKDSVIGIFNEVKEMYDDFIPKGVFYLNGVSPFRQNERIGKKLNYLVENGYEIGNHTYGHEKFNSLSDDQIQKTIGKQAQFLESFVNDYEVVHLSIPYGVRPDEDQIEVVFSGIYENLPYKNISGVNVGWNPIMPFGHNKFNPRSINRITCGFDDFELHYWLDYFEKNPHKKYISDGNPSALVVPSSGLEQVHEAYLESVIVYDAKEEE